MSFNLIKFVQTNPCFCKDSLLYVLFFNFNATSRQRRQTYLCHDVYLAKCTFLLSVHLSLEPSLSSLASAIVSDIVVSLLSYKSNILRHWIDIVQRRWKILRWPFQYHPDSSDQRCHYTLSPVDNVT